MAIDLEKFSQGEKESPRQHFEQREGTKVQRATASEYTTKELLETLKKHPFKEDVRNELHARGKIKQIESILGGL